MPPFSISVAGFKALPHQDPPILDFPGVSILSGSNSGGKSSLTLALRPLRESVLHDLVPRAMHLRVPGVPRSRLGSIHTVHHGGDLFRPIRFRFATLIGGDPSMLELSFRMESPLRHIFRDSLLYEQRVMATPWSIPLHQAAVYEMRDSADDAAWRDLWSQEWVLSARAPSSLPAGSNDLMKALRAVALDFGIVAPSDAKWKCPPGW